MATTVPTSAGPAEVDVRDGAGPHLLVLTHGSAGDVDARDLTAAADAAAALGWSVARVTQPFRRAGRRAPGPAPVQDRAWCEVLARLRDTPASGGALVVGGRSNGARVACRTAVAVGADAVLALAFPVHPPGRPDRDRLAELALPPVPVLVVQGDRDPFGRPPRARGRRVALVAGTDHGLRGAEAVIAREVRRLLRQAGTAREAP